MILRSKTFFAIQMYVIQSTLISAVDTINISFEQRVCKTFLSRLVISRFLNFSAPQRGIKII